MTKKVWSWNNSCSRREQAPQTTA